MASATSSLWATTCLLFNLFSSLGLNGFYFSNANLFWHFRAVDMKNTIKVERAKLNMTRQDLADLISVSRQTINSIEAGKYVPSTVLALKIARAFKVSIKLIFEL
ncbi:MAG: putative transcriptional regulator [Algoriphagus sp.]|jgi:putative transcriptional regulator